MEKYIMNKDVGGNIGGENLICSAKYKYKENPFEYLGCTYWYDGGKKADEEGYFTFKSTQAFFKSKGNRNHLVKVTDGSLS